MYARKQSFSQETVEPSDIEHCKKLCEDTPLALDLYQAPDEAAGMLHFKLFSRAPALIILSDIVPILENMGLRILNETPYEISLEQGATAYVNDYQMTFKKDLIFYLEQIKENFQSAFYKIWSGEMENDSFNHLVLYAGLEWREVSVLRAYAKYLWQAGFNFSQEHVENTLIENPTIVVLLMNLFKARFSLNDYSAIDLKEKIQAIEVAREKIQNLNDDRILGHYVCIILATLRTNYYQTDATGQYKSYFSFKLDSSQVPELPAPVPLYEIFVYSPRMEGIHLRAAKVSRGGIRWSERPEDFRTEILSLMKTQQVKNAVIVPMGAKGGFILKKVPANASGAQLNQEVQACYQLFIRGLLDITDNYKGDTKISPLNVRSYDSFDPYLVVAADKGTATFSDIANDLAHEYEFWLGDAFASGGKTGYDHKKMAITARGAWESVKVHFQDCGIDPEQAAFTVVGIGDMSGDVFGNGLLLSKNMKLIAAFNHIEIFLDPNPDLEKSYAERSRLFALKASKWSDYHSACISKGGGVFSRLSKMIELSPEIQEALGLQQTKIDPNKLIQSILKAPVDLLWNGGIGTYVKASQETQLSVADKSNDALRISGCDLRAKVVAEGGNLGFTQLGRIEYAKEGGHINTDAIDNSGGVNCSDFEVNIKILLSEAQKASALNEADRNETLNSIQEEVAHLVLNNNRIQTKAISLSASKAADNLEMHERVIQDLERDFKLNRSLEGLPDQKEIKARKKLGAGLTRPELAVLMAYSKMALKAGLLDSNLPEDPYFQCILEGYFPKPLQKSFKPYLSKHYLKREIIATSLSGALINDMGISFVTRLQDETGATSSNIMRAYTLVNEIFKTKILQDRIDALWGRVDIEIQHQMHHELNRLIRRAARWFLKNKAKKLDIESTIQVFAPKLAIIEQTLSHLISGPDQETQTLIAFYQKAGVPLEVATQIASLSAMFSALDIVSAAHQHSFAVDQLAIIYYEMGERLELGRLRILIKNQRVHDHWEALARASFRDDLDRQQRDLSLKIIKQGVGTTKTLAALIDQWLEQRQGLVNRWHSLSAELRNTPVLNFTMFAVLLKELWNMNAS